MNDAKYLIKKSKIRLLRGFPFFGFILLKTKIVFSDEEKIAATDGIKIYINKQKMNHMKKEDADFILGHEILHIVLRHTLRAKGVDELLWNIATDLKVNQMLKDSGFHDPPSICPIMPWMFHEYGITKKFVREASAERIYEKLKDIPKEKIDKINKTRIDKLKDPKETFDEEMSEEEIKYKIEETVQRLVIEAVRCHEERFGHVPGWMENLVDIFVKPSKLPWHVLLRRNLLPFFPDNYSYRRLSRRAYIYDLSLPHRSKKGSKLVVAVDVSGSIDDSVYAKFVNEIVQMIRIAKAKAKVLLFDYVVQKVISDIDVAKINNAIKELQKRKGYGGTSFVLVFDWIKKSEPFTKIAVVFTDARGTYPTYTPKHPTIWVLAGDCPKNRLDKDYPKFGRVIYAE